MRLRTAVFPPMPRPRVSIATSVKPGLLRSMRAAKSRSRHNVSTTDSQPPERTISFVPRSEEHTSELQSHSDLVCRLLLEKKKSLTPHNNQAQRLRSPTRPHPNHPPTA